MGHEASRQCIRVADRPCYQITELYGTAKLPPNTRQRPLRSYRVALLCACCFQQRFFHYRYHACHEIVAPLHRRPPTQLHLHAPRHQQRVSRYSVAVGMLVCATTVLSSVKHDPNVHTHSHKHHSNTTLQLTMLPIHAPTQYCAQHGTDTANACPTCLVAGIGEGSEVTEA